MATSNSSNKKIFNPIHNPLDVEGSIDLPSGSEPGSVEFRPKHTNFSEEKAREPAEGRTDVMEGADDVMSGAGELMTDASDFSHTHNAEMRADDGIDVETSKADISSRGDMPVGQSVDRGVGPSGDMKPAWDRPMSVHEESHNPLTIERMRNHSVRGGYEGAPELEAEHRRMRMQKGKKNAA